MKRITLKQIADIEFPEGVAWTIFETLKGYEESETYRLLVKVADAQLASCEKEHEEELKDLIEQLKAVHEAFEVMVDYYEQAVEKARIEEGKKMANQYEDLIKETILPDAKKRFWDEIEAEYQYILVPKKCIPEGEMVEAYKTDREIIIIGDPEDEHNCDDMGCGTLSHVIYRFALKSGEEVK